MKLYYNPASPYSRKVLVCVHELGMAGDIETLVTQPFTDESYRAVNPLGKVPALVTESRGTLYDSSVICEYLDGLCTEKKIFPSAQGQRIAVRCLHALGAGMTDAAVNLRQNMMRGEGENISPLPDDWYVARQYSAIAAGMAEASARLGEYDTDVNIGSISIACFLEYWNFRFAAHPWRADYPELSGWLEHFSKRDSMHKTRPF